MNSEPKTHASLFEHLRKPVDHKTWPHFVALYRPIIISYVISHRLLLTDAEDIWQEVQMAFLRHLEDFQYDPSKSFRAWLKTVTLNKIRDLARRRHREARGTGDSAVHQRLADLPIEGSATDELDIAYYHELFLNAVELVRPDFSADTFDAFSETVIAGKSVREVALKLKISENAVRIRKSRVFAAVKKHLSLANDSEDEG